MKMKRLFCALLALWLLVSGVPVGVRAADYLYGDVNGDGKINAKDATLILRYAVGKLTDLSEYDWEAANVNGDDRVNAKDATLILRYSVHKLDKFPADTHKHSYDAVVTQPTCTEGGYTTYTCSCGDSYTGDETDALGHSWGEWVVTTEPTTSVEGQETRECERCGKTETRAVEKLPEETEPETGCTSHSWGNWTSDDYGSYGSCTNCGQSITIDGSNAQYASDVAKYINEYRVAAGLAELQYVDINFARIRAEEITIQFSHKRLDGSQHGMDECIATGSSAQSVAEGWYNSSGHNPSIMREGATRIYAARCGIYWIIIVR